LKYCVTESVRRLQSILDPKRGIFGNEPDLSRALKSMLRRARI
jgi:hypothetical protein